MIARALILLTKGWQKGPSAILPPSCRFQPSCSAYAITAWSRYGAAKGSWLALKRIGRCHPWGGQGFDPVPALAERNKDHPNS
jgi:putative membrane protein insertion efficiency factor